MTFKAPVRELAFAMRTAGHWLVTRHIPDLDDDTVQAVLESAAAFAENELAPLNRAGDVHGARFADGKVTAPPGFAGAYQAFAAQGWNALSADPAHGGQGLSKALELAVFEIVHAANMAFGLCPMLTQGAIEALTLHGTPRQKRLILPQLVKGAWTGTMNLTEPQAGSDLAALATRAEPDGQGGYRLTGEKIFITWGDHDAAENICHLVLARTPDAPPGVKGVSLFLATRTLVNEDGSLGGRNALRPGSIEHKLGIHGSPTCVMLFEGAQAELVGELGRGLSHMFVMMNAARLQVGVQGVAIAERAFQQALAFSLERRQGRTIWSAETPARIYDHPDVRRTLTYMKARIEAARALCLTVGVLSDLTRSPELEAQCALLTARRDLLTPIAKAWATDVGVETASLGLQIHGGMGFIEETGAAQHYRDARIAPIYEGTNGIQAADLVGRKVRADGGATMRRLCEDIALTAGLLNERPELAAMGWRLAAAGGALERATDWIAAAPDGSALAAATPYLGLAGDVIGGWLLGRQALAAAEDGDEWLRARRTLARAYAARVLSQAPGLADGLMESAVDLEQLSPSALSFGA